MNKFANHLVFAALSIVLISGLPPNPGRASGHVEPAHICDNAAQGAARETGVPLSVLQAITRTETGRKKNGRFTPWPWTVNMEGKGVWFDSLDEARSYVFRHFKTGARSFDIGCFQINYKWHHQGFTSIEEMFDPEANALYAARFLGDLFAEFGNWADAAGAYHSRTPKYANRYKAIFEKHRNNAPGETVMAVANDNAPARSPVLSRVNNFPLLQSGSGARLGSLVPLGNRATAGGILETYRSGQKRLVGG